MGIVCDLCIVVLLESVAKAFSSYGSLYLSIVDLCVVVLLESVAKAFSSHGNLHFSIVSN